MSMGVNMWNLDNVICQKRFFCCLSIWMETKGVIKTIGLFWIVQRAADKLVLVNYFLLKQIRSPFPEGSIFTCGKGTWGVWSCKISNIIWAYPHILPTIWTSLKIYIETYWHIDLKTLKDWRRDIFIEKFHCFLHLFFSKGFRARKK